MKYTLNQTVFYIDFEFSKIKIKSMEIYKITRGTINYKDIYYSGIIKASDNEEKSLYENWLFATHNEALLEIRMQIEELKNEA